MNNNILLTTCIAAGLFFLLRKKNTANVSDVQQENAPVIGINKTTSRKQKSEIYN